MKKLMTLPKLLSKSLILTCSFFMLSHSNYLANESQKIPSFEDLKMPVNSQLIEVKGIKIQLTSAKPDKRNPKGTILLLSGPTDYWYADSAWFSLLQPMLAQEYQVHAVERPGIGFSEDGPNMGYGSLADYLAPVIKQLSDEPVIIVAYASANLSLWPFLANPEHHKLVKSVVLVDPDVLLPHSIKQYKGDAAPFLENFTQYKNYLEAGNYHQRTASFIKKETEHVTALIKAEQTQLMNWPYFQQMMQTRQTIRAQVNKLIEVANYGSHLDRAYAAGDPTAIPLYIIDTDFESKYIKANPDNESLPIWQKQGTEWFKKLAKNSRGFYQPLNGVDHLVPFATPEVIVQAVKKLNGD